MQFSGWGDRCQAEPLVRAAANALSMMEGEFHQTAMCARRGSTSKNGAQCHGEQTVTAIESSHAPRKLLRDAIAVTNSLLRYDPN